MTDSELLADVVEAVARHHGDPRIKILEPQFQLKRVCAVWVAKFDGVEINCGVQIDGRPDPNEHRVRVWGPHGVVEATMVPMGLPAVLRLCMAIGILPGGPFSETEAPGG